MRKISTIYCVLFSFLLAASCSDFLNEKPRDKVYPASAEDFNELLAGEGYMNVTKGNDIRLWVHLMDDDVLFEATTHHRPSADGVAPMPFYWWEPEVNTESTWKTLYQRISIMNVILSEIDEFRDEPGDTYRRVKGEAYFLRAAYYYFLVNIYAKPYHPQHSLTDPGVPLKLDPVVLDKQYARDPVKACYDQIVSDLEAAVSHLEGLTSATTYRAGVMAARLLLSRVHLYMGNWEEVVRQCDAVLADRSYHLLDFNGFEPLAAVNAVWAKSPETIFSNGRNYSSFFVLRTASGDNLRFYFRGSDEILSLYGSGDLRKEYFFRRDNSWFPQKSTDDYDGSDFFMLRLPEAYLNKAEALVCLGRDAEAVPLIRALREKRLKEGTPGEITATGEELLNIVRDERRREFTFEGHRWFDLRRNAVHPKWPFQKEIRHPYYVLSEVVGDIVLGKYDDDRAYYVMPVPEFEIALSGGVMVQNEKRVLKTAE